jgi:regulator of protease activity HflC (stomatin/prohibitin superfamily)
MDTALGWIGDIVRAFLMFVPRRVIIRTTHSGVKWVFGSRVKIMTHNNGWFKTGIHIWWPLTTEIEVEPIKRRTSNLSSQILTTKDGMQVGVSGVLVWNINNIDLYCNNCHDPEDVINDLGLAAIKLIISENDYEFLVHNSLELDKRLTLSLRPDLRKFGIRTMRVTLSDFTKMLVLGNWNV